MARRSFRFVQRPIEPEAILDEQMKEVVTRAKKVERRMLDKRRKYVKDWRNKPTFKGRTAIGPRHYLRTTIEVGNANTKVKRKRGSKRRGGKRLTIGELWDGHDKFGFRPHKITPRGDYPLRFRYGPGYKARTRPGTLRTSTPRQGRKHASTYEVNHPGSEPRKVTETINKVEVPKMEKAIDDGMRIGFNKAKRKARRGGAGKRR